jgi:hypothetical protein
MLRKCAALWTSRCRSLFEEEVVMEEEEEEEEELEGTR